MQPSRLRAPLFAVLAASALAACQSGEASARPQTREISLPADQVLYGFEQNITKGGVRSIMLASDTVYLHEDGSRADLFGVDLKVHNEAGVQTAHLRALGGEYQPAAETMTARGKVVLISSGAEGPRRLETEELHLDVKGDRMWSTKPVVLREGPRTVRGSSFESNASFADVRIRGAKTTGGISQGNSGIIPF